jgi:uncharacterized membrane protein (Fun14 family)
MIVTWVDGLALAILGLYVWQEYERSRYAIVANMVGWLTGFYIVWEWSKPVKRWLVMSFGIETQMAAYVAMLGILVIVWQVLSRIIEHVSQRLPNQYPRSWFMRSLWFAPTVISGLGFVTLLMIAFAGFPGTYALKQDISDSWWGRVVSFFWMG